MAGDPHAPIGMFDSGFGGLTVARAVIDELPSEDIVYIGDTGRYPYGSKTADQIVGYSRQIARSLVEDFGVKMIVIACNSAASVSEQVLASEFDVPVVGVIEPGVRALAATTRNKKVGVIGTVATVNSGTYQSRIAERDPNLRLVAAACPGFVEFVERGQTSGEEVTVLAERLLAPVKEAGVDALLLGCTHYPYLEAVIADVMGADVRLVSSADETALAVREVLDERGWRRPSGGGTHRFFSSGDVDSFVELGRRLLGPELDSAGHWPL